MQNLKAAQQQQLILAFGILIQPFTELATTGRTPKISEYRIAIAKVQSGIGAWRRQAKEFCTFADDVILDAELSKLSTVPRKFCTATTRGINRPYWETRLEDLHKEFQKGVTDSLTIDFFDCLNRIPVDWEPVIFEANTPFTAYTKIKDALAVINNRFHYFDRYLQPEFFDLFLRDVDRHASTRLITTAIGAKNVEAVSRLVGQEFSDYQLIVVDASKMHD